MSEGWEEILPIYLGRLEKIVLDHKASDKWEDTEKQSDVKITEENNELVSLLEQIPCSEKVDLHNIAEWMGQDDIEEINEDDIVIMVLNEE